MNAKTLMKTRLKDIAEKLDLSTALVSGVLNHRENVWASEGTRNRIFEAARILNYDHSAGPRAKQADRAEVALLGDKADAHMAHLLSQHLRISLVAHSTVTDAKRWASNRTSEPVLLCGNSSFVREIAPLVGTRVVALGSFDDLPDLPQADLDYDAMTQAALDHLRALGHRQIGRVGADAHPLLGSETVVASEESIEEMLDGPTTAWLVAGGEAWSLLEACLARRARRLGFAPGEPAACGVLEAGRCLSLGMALGFDLGTSSAELAREIATLISSAERETIRVRPRLTRLRSLAKPEATP